MNKHDFIVGLKETCWGVLTIMVCIISLSLFIFTIYTSFNAMGIKSVGGITIHIGIAIFILSVVVCILRVIGRRTQRFIKNLK